MRLAFGGMWYAIVNAADVGLELRPRYGKDICKYGEMIKVATRERHPVNHPLFDYPGPDILCFRGPPSEGHASGASKGAWKGGHSLLCLFCLCEHPLRRVTLSFAF